MKKKLSILTLLLFMMTVFAGIRTEATTEPVVATQEGDIVTKVTIHKLQASKYNDGIPQTNENGDPIDITTIGTDVKGLPGVQFTAYEISETDFNTYSANPSSIPPNPNSIPPTPSGEHIYLGETDTNGSLTWTETLTRTDGKITPKYYAVYETKKPDEVSGSIAVPFVIAFPMTSADGTTFLTDVNIYPKNITGSLPEAGKDIAAGGIKTASFNIGESFQYILKGTIPTNIEAYSVYKFNDTLNPALTYDSEVTATGMAGTTPLVAGDDFTITSEGQNITVSLTEDGIGKIAAGIEFENRGKLAPEEIKTIAANSNEKPYIEIKFNVKMNGTAPMATEIENTATITYKHHGLEEPATSSPSDKVTVVTGGKIFTKVDGEKSLSGAEFTLQEENNNVIWTQELLEANKATGDNATKFVDPKIGQPVKMVSSDDGTFSFMGLAYSAMGTNGTTSTNYFLTETKAPVGYQLLKDRVPFTVDVTSHTSNLKITNSKKPVIPATGGIGTLIFIVGGLGLMFLAVKGYKKQAHSR